eukprot:10066650-Alexandrium_andersonii.AAC.1
MAGWARLRRTRPGVIAGRCTVVLPPSCLPPPPKPSLSSSIGSSSCSLNIDSTSSMFWRAPKP